jgi:GPI mannosyltransferase 3
MRLRLLESYEPKEKVALWVSLLLHICCAWFSIGYHYDDEHWQILEFANYKLGLSPASDLPWEFVDQIRPTLQPFIVYVFAKFMMVLHFYNPFTLIFLLRLVSAVLSWLATLLVIKSTRMFFVERDHFYYLILFSSFLWFIPYIHVRYSGETWSGLFFFFGFYYLLAILEEKNRPKGWIVKSFLVGICMGISFWCRFQIMFAILGLGAWILVYKLENIDKIVPAIFGGLLMLVIGFVVDHWFYGNWVFTPYNYFESNIIKNIAARYGVTPWWDYFWLFILQAGIPISIVLLITFILSVITKPKNPYVWIFIAFILGHMAVGHKEMRFLFPLVYIMPIVSFLFFNTPSIINRFKKIPRRIIRIVIGALITMNSILLFVVVFIKPPAENVLLYDYIYAHANGKPIKIITQGPNPYAPGNLKVNFYSPSNFEIIAISDLSSLKSFANNEDWTVFYFDDHFDLDEKTKNGSAVKFDLAYRNYPPIVQKFNFNGWVDRQKIYSLYTIR